MRFYVICKIHQHEQERIYVVFQSEPATRGQLPMFFTVACPSTKIPINYTPADVIAEVGAAPIGGAIIGGLLFLVDPLLGIIGLIAGAAGVNNAEQQRCNIFNNSH